MSEELSGAQHAIINYPHDRRHMFVLAAPGSGKTRVIAERVGRLLEQHQVAPEQLIVMTFTEKAAAELEERLENRLASAVQGVCIGTIHNICHRLLKAYGTALGLPSSFHIYDAQRQEEAIRSVVASLGQPLPQRQAVKKLHAAISRHRQRQALALSFGKPEPTLDDDALLAPAYRAYLHAHNALDFDDLILYGLRLFDTQLNPDLAPVIHERVRYVFVDEFHDLSPEQFRLLELLVPPGQSGHQVMAVADANQAIYGWRDADATKMIPAYCHRYHPREFKLIENYRSAGNLVRAAQALITSSGAEARAVSVHPDTHPIAVVACQDEAAEARWLAQQIARACQSGNYHYSDIALLYRRHRRADTLEVTLLGAGIPLWRDEENRFFDDPDVQASIRYLSLIQALHDEPFAPALHWPRVLVDELTMAHLQQLAAAEGLTLSELARQIDTYRTQVSPLTRTVIKDFLDIFAVELVPVAHHPIKAIVSRLLEVLKRRRSPFRRAVRDEVRGLLESLAQPLERLAATVSTVIAAGRPIVLAHDGAIDHAAGAVILAHILEHYFQHPATICTSAESTPHDAFVITLGQAHPPDQRGGGIAVYTTRLGTLAHSVSVQAWRLGQLLLMAQETLRQGRFMLFDLETTGTHVRTTEIVELAALEVEGGRITESFFEALVKPEGRIAPAASQVHGITEKMVQAKPHISAVLPAYLDFLIGVTLVGHNVEAFDYPVLHRIAQTHDLTPPAGPLVDTYKLARRLLPDGSHRLEALAQHFGYKAAQTHRALDDVRMNAHVFTGLLDLLDNERALDIATEVLPLVAVGMRASGLPLDDYTQWFAEAGARALAVGLGRPLWAKLDALVPDAWMLDDHLVWLRRLEHADPEEDQRWIELAQRWQDALALYQQTFADTSLAAFLRYIALATSIDQHPGEQERVTLMTIHSAKGKEWPLVFIVGTEDDTIPSFQCRTEAELAEERRVLYVGMTRAKQRLILSHIAEWKGHQKTPSRFLSDIPDALITKHRVR